MFMHFVVFSKNKPEPEGPEIMKYVLLLIAVVVHFVKKWGVAMGEWGVTNGASREFSL